MGKVSNYFKKKKKNAIINFQKKRKKMTLYCHLERLRIPAKTPARTLVACKARTRTLSR